MIKSILFLWQRFLKFLISFLFAMLFVFGFTSSQIFAETQVKSTSIQYAELYVARALNFKQGDLVSLLDAKDDFTAKGWREFIKTLDGWVDHKGAPSFSSNFNSSGKLLDIRKENKSLYLVIPCILKQESKLQNGLTSINFYRAEIKVKLIGSPLKIEEFKQMTCGGAKTKLSCR